MSGLPNEQPVSGTQYVRAHTIVLTNPLGSAPGVAYQAEAVLLVDGAPAFRKHAGVLSGEVDVTAMIDLRDPQTGALTGQSVPVALVYQALYSDFLNRLQATTTPAAPDA